MNKDVGSSAADRQGVLPYEAKIAGDFPNYEGTVKNFHKTFPKKLSNCTALILNSHFRRPILPLVLHHLR
jgi:hypothetical protein